MPGDIFRFAAGAVLFCVAYVSVWRPSKLYVLGHELTHVIFGLMCGSKVSKFKVKKEEGSVVLSRPWMVPSLAPYFFPIYSVLALALYGAASWAAGGLPLWLDGLFVAAVGFFWGFHVCFTVNGLLQKQNDVEPFGFFFSYMFILTMNAAVLAVELTAVSQVDFSELSAVFGEMSGSVVSALWSLKAG